MAKRRRLQNQSKRFFLKKGGSQGATAKAKTSIR
jgi:hypothetical protein